MDNLITLHKRYIRFNERTGKPEFYGVMDQSYMIYGALMHSKNERFFTKKGEFRKSILIKGKRYYLQT